MIENISPILTSIQKLLENKNTNTIIMITQIKTLEFFQRQGLRPLLLAFSVFSASLVFAHDIFVDNIYYNINATEATVTFAGTSYDSGQISYSGNVTIPSTVTYNGITYTVTAIGDYAFYYCSDLTNVSIPNTVTTIGDHAFFCCKSLTNVTIPNSVIDIRTSAFHRCENLTNLIIGNSVRHISESAFSGCSSLTSVTIPNSVTYIGYGAFSECSSMTSVTIPSSVNHISVSAFSSCSSLINITVSNGNPNYDSRDNCNAIIETATNTLIAGCQKTIIPNSVNSIGQNAFSGCSNLTSITIPNSVTHIGYSAFSLCRSLNSITIPNSVTNIGTYAFLGCDNMANVTIGNSVTTIGDHAFFGCRSLTSVTIPNSVTEIGNSAFWNCENLSNVTIGNSLTAISDIMFYGCSKLSNITIPNSVTSIGGGAFEFCSGLSNIEIPNSVEYIGSHAFFGCSSLTNLTIPNSIATINRYSFGRCNNLSKITIGFSVNYIENYAFTECDNLNEIVCLPYNPPEMQSNDCFTSPTYQHAELIVPCNSGDDYRNKPYWYHFKKITASLIEELIESLDLNTSSVSLYVGETEQLIADVYPENATNKSLSWHSSNTSIAEVLPNGIVTAKSPGNVLIIVKTDDGSNLSDTCYLEVKQRMVTSISLNTSSATLYTNETLQLSATVLPLNADDKAVIWTSSNPSVATVSSTGLVSAVSVGNATITASTADGSNLSASCSVVVYQLATSISLNETSATIYTGNTLQLTATVSPSTTSNPSVTWTSSNTSVATVSSSGIVTAKSRGTTVITAKTTDGTNLSANCNVTVKQLATSISLNETSATIFTGNTLQLTATISPSTTSNPSVTWTSSNTSVATVSSSGVVTAKSTGTTVITARTADGSNLSATCNVTVKQLATSISLNKTSATLYMGNTLQLMATVLPNNTTDKSVSWSSSNADVAVVSSDGLVTPISTGTATITVKTEDGSNLTAQCVITVKQYASSISLSETDATIYTGNTLQLTATVLPSTTSNPSVTWSSSNTSVVTVSSTGLVTAKSTGNAIITAKTSDGTNLSATCNITVKRLATSISLNKSSATLYLNETVQLTATVSPSNATDKSVLWSSSDNNVAAVTSTGWVTAIAPGNAVITATTTDGSNLSATCIITVKAYVTSLTLDPSEVTILEGDTITLAPTILPSYATNQSLYWSSSNTNVVSIYDGVVVGRSGGEATITARTSDGSNLSAYSKVTVIPNFDISAPNFSHIRGSANNKFDLTIDLANRYDITGMQFDIQFPDGVTIVKDNNGEYDIWLDDARKTRNHTATASLIGNNTYRILVSSATANSLKGHSGTVVHIMIEIPLYHVSGNKQVRYSNIILSEPDETRHTLPTKYSMISYYYMEGDANADIDVDVADYVITGNYILQNSPDNFWYDAANVDHNSTIDVNDLTGITNIALGRREGGVLQMPSVQAYEDHQDIELTANPLVIQAGQTKSLNLCLDGIHEFAGFQMDVQMPKGIRLVDASLVNDNSGFRLATAELADGCMRLLASSFSLKNLAVNNTAFLTLTLTAENSFNGNDIITLDKVKFSERDMVLHTLDNVVIHVGNDVSGLEKVYNEIHIYAEGNNIIIDCPESGTARMVTISGITYVRDVLPGHNVIPMEDSGFYIVTLNGTTAKLRLN